MRILALSEASQHVLIRDVMRRVHAGVDLCFVTRYSVKKNVGVTNEAVTTLKEHAALLGPDIVTSRVGNLDFRPERDRPFESNIRLNNC